MLKLICPNTDVFDKSILEQYKKYFNCKFYNNLSQSKFNKISNNYDIILLRFNHYLKLNQKSKIKFVLSPTTGINHIDKNIFRNKKIKIFNLKNKAFLNQIKASSEFTYLLILSTLRKLKNFNQNNLIGEELNEKKVGIIGFGRIGKNVAKFCSNLNANIVFYDSSIKKSKTKKFKNTSINNLLKTSNIIIICITYNEKNFKVINKKKINLIKKNSMVINTSRGEIIDEEYIFKLAKKKFLYYSTDVLQNEQFIDRNYYKKMNKNSNILISKHLGGLTKESIYKTDEEIFKNFLKYYEQN